MGGWSRVLALRKSGERAAHDARVLGGGDFVASIVSEAEANIKRQVRKRKERDRVAGIIRTGCKEAGIREAELRAGGKRREVTKVRGQIAYRLSRELGLSLAEIARQLGVGTSAIGMALGKRETEK